MEESLPQVNKTFRPPAVAGSFYPDDPKALARMVDQFLITAERNQVQKKPERMLKALIVPHAGFRYSGQIAAAAYVKTRKYADRITRVVLVGPAHRVRMDGLAISSANYFSTPLGTIPVDADSVSRCLKELDFVSIDDNAHKQEHSLETQLPFLQRCLKRFSLVPLLVGSAAPEKVEQCLDLLWGGDETLVLISSDLSHFLSYQDAQRMDSFTASAILDLDPAVIGYDHACGQIGVRGLLNAAARKKMDVIQLDVRNSGDTSGRKDQVVGYGSFAFYDG